MFANLLALPFLLGTLSFLYLAWNVDSSYAPWMVPFLIVGALIVILSPQINWWWYRRNPPRLSPGLTNLLSRFCGFYQTLSPADQKKFESRIGLFRMGTNWTPIGWQEDFLPPDVELALAAQAVSLTFHREQFLFPAFEKVIVYPRLFPSPEYPYPHASELYAPDGCLIFSAENVMHAFFNPGKYYQVGLHEYASAFVMAYPREPWPELDATNIWQQLELASGMSKSHLETAIGLSDPDPLAVAIHHFFVFPDYFKKVLTVEHTALAKIFSVSSLPLTTGAAT